jgi:hypothetical protein
MIQSGTGIFGIVVFSRSEPVCHIASVSVFDRIEVKLGCAGLKIHG